MKLNLGPEFLKYLAAHASEYGKHPPTLEERPEELDRDTVNRGSILVPHMQRDLLRLDEGSRYECFGVA